MIDPDYALLIAAVETGSLSAAARTMGISPPMASKRMARLEARLGVRLAHRTTRRFALTEAGLRLHGEVMAIAAAVARAERAVAGRGDTPHGPLRMTAPTSFGRLHVAPHLGSFLGIHPAVELTLDLSDGFVDLIGGRIDLAIRIAADVGGGLVGHRLADNRRILCAAPDYLATAGAPRTLADLTHHRLLAADGQLPWRLTQHGRAHRVEGVSAVRTNSSEVVRELALSGLGIALRSSWDVGGDLAGGRLQRVLPQVEGAADVAIHAVHPRAEAVPAAVRAMIAHLKRCYGDVPVWER